jgi:hypothetical protein
MSEHPGLGPLEDAKLVVGVRAGDPEALALLHQRFALKLHEGTVRVVMPAPYATREVVAGERLELELGRAVPAAAVTVQPPPEAAALPSSPPLQPSAVRTVSTWRKLAAAGAYREAFRALSAEGLRPLLRTGAAADLARAADVARFAQQPAEARRALIALRARFPSTQAAAEAAFALGRLEFEQPASAAEAARWFEVYLQEHPRRAFRREASGRLIECQVRLQHPDRAAQLAREYLALFADGPHASLAHAVLQGASPHAR